MELIIISLVAFTIDGVVRLLAGNSLAGNSTAYFGNILRLGLENTKSGRYKEAIQAWDKGIRLNDKYAEAYYYRGFAYYNLGDYQRAIQDYDQAIRLYPKYAEVYNNCGNACYQLADYERAVKDYKKAVNIDLKYTQASENLIAAQKKLDELPGKSKKILTQLVIIPPLGFVLGSRHIFSVKAFDQNNQEMSIGQVAWHTTGGNIDRDGTFHAGQTPGRFTVTATVGSIKDEIDITVVEPKKLTTLVIAPAKVEIESGEERTFSVKGLDQHNREMFIEPVQWQTSDGSIDSNGTFKAGQTPGSFTVTATVKSIMGQASVTVVKTKVDEPYKHILGLKDRVTQQEFTVGDKVYFCTSCQLGYHQDSWEYLNCKCDQCKNCHKVEIYILPDTVVSKTINTPSELSKKEIDLGALRGIDANGCSSSIREAINNWTDIFDRNEDDGFRFTYTEIQTWGSTEYSVRRIIASHKTGIEVENFDGSRLLLPIRLLGNILSPIGRVIWQSAVFLAHSINETLKQKNSETNSDSLGSEDDHDLEEIYLDQEEENLELSDNDDLDEIYEEDLKVTNRYLNHSNYIDYVRLQLFYRNQDYNYRNNDELKDYLRYNCTYNEFVDYIRYVRDHCFDE